MTALVQGLSLFALIFLGELSAALPAGDTTPPPAGNIETSADTSDYPWVSSWASDPTGTESIPHSSHLDGVTRSSSNSSQSTGSISNSSSQNITRIVVPVVVAVGLIGLVAACLMLVRMRRRRALRAHRRRSSWIASKKFRWQPDGTAYPESTQPAQDLKEPIPSPIYPEVQAPAPATTHERKASIL